MNLPRFVHHFYANLFSYFWLPCRVCGRYFGGHQIGGGRVREGGHIWITCPKCPGEYSATGWVELGDLAPGETLSIPLPRRD